MKEVIIIPKEGEDSKLYYREKFDSFTKHYTKVNKYIKDNNIPIEEKNSIYLLGVSLALRDFCIIDIDNNEFVVYLPLKLTKKQYDWFIKYKDSIIHMDVNVVSIEYEDNEYMIRHIDKNTSKQNSVNRLYKEIEKKLKKEKEVVIDGNNRCK